MAKKKLLWFLTCDYRGCSPPKDFLVMVHGIFAGLGTKRVPAPISGLLLRERS